MLIISNEYTVKKPIKECYDLLLNKLTVVFPSLLLYLCPLYLGPFSTSKPRFFEKPTVVAHEFNNSKDARENKARYLNIINYNKGLMFFQWMDLQ